MSRHRIHALDKVTTKLYQRHGTLRLKQTTLSVEWYICMKIGSRTSWPIPHGEYNDKLSQS